MADRKTATEPDVSLVALVEPPPVSRARESSVSRAILDAMASQIGNGWVTNGETYGDKKIAQNDASKHKRSLATFMRRDEKELASRVWQTDSGFVFALGVRNRDAATAA